MKEIRDFIIHLSKDEKKTIFLSSHILYEVELVANRMIIINKGTTKVEGYVKDLLNAKKLKVSFEVNDEEKTNRLLAQSDWINKLESQAKTIFMFSLRMMKLLILINILLKIELLLVLLFQHDRLRIIS